MDLVVQVPDPSPNPTFPCSQLSPADAGRDPGWFCLENSWGIPLDPTLLMQQDHGICPLPLAQGAAPENTRFSHPRTGIFHVGLSNSSRDKWKNIHVKNEFCWIFPWLQRWKNTDGFAVGFL